MACFTGNADHKESSPPYYANFMEFEPNYADLPMKILLKIFSYLTPSDRHEAGLTCHRWFQAANHSTFLDRFWLVLHCIEFDSNQTPMRMLLDSFRHFPNVQLREVAFERLGNFFQHFGPHIRRIEFNHCDLQENALFDILCHLPKLRSLSIQWYLNESDGILLYTNPSEKDALREILSEVTELTLAHIYFLSDASLHRALEIMPSLSSLGFRGCNVSYDLPLFRKYYPSGRKQLSESGLTIDYILQVIAERKALLRALDFSQTDINNNVFEALATLGPDLQLGRLTLEHCQRLYGPGLGTLLRVQAAHLQELNLSHSYRVTDYCLVQIYQDLSKLRVLKLNSCSSITNEGVRQMALLTQLEVLDVSKSSINGDGILEGIASKKQASLRELYVSCLDLSERSIIAITENLPELRVLDLSYCSSAMSDLCLQFVCRNLVRLKQLNLDYCYKVSDEGLTGLGMLGRMQRYMQAVDELNEDSRMPETGFSVGNGNQKAQPGHDVHPPAKVPTVACYSIERLQQLQVLSLTVCDSVTDVSLLNLRLLALRELSLAGCTQVTHVGIQALVRGCPGIERLNLNWCDNMTDELVHQIVLPLRQLRELRLRGRCHTIDCSQRYTVAHKHRVLRDVIKAIHSK